MPHLNDPIPIVTGADDNFALPLGVTLYSILRNVNEETKLHFYILDGGIQEDNRERIYRVFQQNGWEDKHQMEWIIPDTSSVKHLPRHNWMSEATYLRLLIPEILPSQLEKAIYLDSDLILETDIAGLWNHAIDDAIIWAAIDVFVQTLSHSTGVVNYHELGGQADSPYFNTGVMLINLDLWRGEKISEKAMDYLVKNKDAFTLHEQEALNAALIGKWKELDPRWNQQGSIYWPQVLPDSEFTEILMEMHNELMNEPFIVHYLSKSKPWDYKCMHPLTHHFLFYLKDSGWFSRSEWIVWWYRFYYRRFMWLFSDLRQTLNQVKIRKAEWNGENSVTQEIATTEELQIE